MSVLNLFKRLECDLEDDENYSHSGQRSMSKTSNLIRSDNRITINKLDVETDNPFVRQVLPKMFKNEQKKTYENVCTNTSNAIENEANFSNNSVVTYDDLRFSLKRLRANSIFS